VRSLKKFPQTYLEPNLCGIYHQSRVCNNILTDMFFNFILSLLSLLLLLLLSLFIYLFIYILHLMALLQYLLLFKLIIDFVVGFDNFHALFDVCLTSKKLFRTDGVISKLYVKSLFNVTRFQ